MASAPLSETVLHPHMLPSHVVLAEPLRPHSTPRPRILARTCPSPLPNQGTCSPLDSHTHEASRHCARDAPSVHRNLTYGMNTRGVHVHPSQRQPRGTARRQDGR
eukprot:scaffold4841_cov121-Isochrysis_galbana.AAC.11